MRAKNRIEEMNKQLLENLKELSETKHSWISFDHENNKKRKELLTKIEYNLEVIKLIAENL